MQRIQNDATKMLRIFNHRLKRFAYKSFLFYCESVRVIFGRIDFEKGTQKCLFVNDISWSAQNLFSKAFWTRNHPDSKNSLMHR